VEEALCVPNHRLPVGTSGFSTVHSADPVTRANLDPVTRANLEYKAINITNMADVRSLSDSLASLQSIEPEWYMPILPTVLINGAHGIGTGWSTDVPCYNPREIVVSICFWPGQAHTCENLFMLFAQIFASQNM
jgi:hypothetical protein